MANGKLLRQLIRSGLDGDVNDFRAASKAVIDEERGKNHHLLANDLERLLYGTETSKLGSQSHVKLTFAMPTNKESGLSLLELRPICPNLLGPNGLGEFHRNRARHLRLWGAQR